MAFRHNHIVPSSYLAQFAEGGMIACHFVGGGDSKEVSIRDAAVRTDFYVHRHPDGTRATEIEQAFGPTEGQAVQIMREVDDRWPLNDDDHGTLSEFLALQFVRSPAWRAYHDATRDEVLASNHREECSETVWARHVAHVSSDPHRSNFMLRQIGLVGTIFGSMHWQLVRFGQDRLVTADHPIACLPAERRTTIEAVPTFGLKNVGEVRLALTPSRALVLTWLDEPSDLPAVRGFPSMARQMNFTLVSQAEKQWFSKPGCSPSVVDQSVHPVGAIIHPSLGSLDIDRSERRRNALAAAQRLADNQDARRDMSIVRIRRAA